MHRLLTAGIVFLSISTTAAWADKCVPGSIINGLYVDTILYQLDDAKGTGKKIKITTKSKSKIKDLGFVRGCGKKFFTLYYKRKPVKAPIADFDFGPKKHGGFKTFGPCDRIGTEGALC